VLSGNGGTAIDADAPSLIALAKQMKLWFDALLRAPDAPPLDHIDAITISPYADEAYERQACAAIESMDPSAAGRLDPDWADAGAGKSNPARSFECFFVVIGGLHKCSEIAIVREPS
jgi:hypothetical protein